MLNPIFIAEALSDSTRDYHLGGKFDLYRQIPALREYITVEQRAVHLITRQRQPDGFCVTTKISRKPRHLSPWAQTSPLRNLPGIAFSA